MLEQVSGTNRTTTRTPSSAFLLILCICHAAAFHYAYMSFVNPNYEYAHYTYNSHDLPIVLLTYALAAAPCMAYRHANAPGVIGASLIYVIGYVPIQLVLLFMWRDTLSSLILLQVVLALSMICIFRVAPEGAGEVSASSDKTPTGPLPSVITSLTAFATALLFAVYGGHMRLVGFADVYDLRFETLELERSVLTDYVLSWYTYTLLPFHLARGIRSWSPVHLSTGLAGSVLVYMSTGGKASLLMPVIVLGIAVLMKDGRIFLQRLLAAMSLLTALAAASLGDSGIGLWVKSIVIVRMQALCGWTVAIYFDYFTRHEYTYYTHIWPVRAVFGGYPYGDLSLGQVIGVEYSGSAAANFNANFWASDGIAALGIAGVPIATAGVCVFIYILNRSARGADAKFMSMWLAGYWLAVLNMPLSTALLSGGGLLVIALLMIARLGRQKVAADPCRREEPLQHRSA